MPSVVKEQKWRRDDITPFSEELGIGVQVVEFV